ncbi:alpha/beta-hydrolase [Basidiobolus meristosporus CBS 931.73]|uniref:Alpha/beta-hydrolase n=1 Tax=Basidiobolus meristosporus CBS 931.73 TaxID=1314790 RepID=A0A1Y1Z9N3_9FUNG|nr:alpha/beta-hydrolase [Basidiobolus meristosporus CBS 931.73]|eukprot:ORY06970.1 alpha/beta-hydrolase [Basidiobolus meristosporus CBS 931.73]
MTSIILLPGNGCENPQEAIWYSWVMEKLKKHVTGETILRQFPDYELCKESIWLPFLKQEIGVDENFILIGHSTGAIAALRYAEKYKVKGIVLVSAYHTDLGDEWEAKSEYFSKEWHWDSIRNNSDWIIQFGSPDDSLVPIAEQRYVHEQVDSEYYELEERGHFVDDNDFPELVEKVTEKLI